MRTHFGFTAALALALASPNLAELPTATTPAQPSTNARDPRDILIRAVSEEAHFFRSPMVLELATDALLDTPTGKFWKTDLTSGFICRGIVIEYVQFNVHPQRSGQFVTTILAGVRNETGKDKRVTVSFESPPSEKARSFGTVTLNVTPDSYNVLKGTDYVFLSPIEEWARDPHPKLRITVTATDF